MCAQKPCPVRFSCPRKSCDPYDSVSIDLVTESVGTTDLQASFLRLVNEVGGQQIVTCIVLSLFLNYMVTIFYSQIYHSLTVFSNSTSWQIKLTQGTNLHSTIFTAVLHSNIPSTYFYFGNKGSWNIVEIVTYALSLYFSTKEKELSHDNCFVPLAFYFVAIFQN